MDNVTHLPNYEDGLVAQHLTFRNIVAALASYFVISVTVSFWAAPRYPTSIPWVGYGKGWLAGLLNTFSALKNSKDWLAEGYDKYSKKGKSFVLPASLGAPAETIIPQSQMQWMLEQPDGVLSTSGAHYDLLHGDYSFVKPIILKDPYHEHIIHKNLARNLNAIIPDLSDEVVRDVDEFFGTSGEWKSINVLDSFMRLVPKITNRMLVGEPLCRNTDYLANMLAFTNDVIRGMLLFPLFPQMLHPILGALLSLPPKYHWWRTSKYSLPLIKKRILDISKKDAGDPAYKGWVEPNDFITWSIRTTAAEGRIDEADATRISIRIMPINFASIHTTALTGQSALLDVISADKSVLEELREEASRVFAEEGNKWTKTGVSRLYRMDSAIRESQRFSTISLTFVHRKVTAKEGITSPEGVHFAYGTLLSCPWKGFSSDEDYHSEPDRYDAFRYSREREAYAAKESEARNAVDSLRLKQNGLVTTSDRHLPFGHGRHAW